MKKYPVLITIILLISLTVIAGYQYSPRFIQKLILSECKNCNLKMNPLYIGQNGLLCSEKVSFHFGDEKASLIKGDVQKVCFRLKFFDLLNGNYNVTKVIVTQPSVEMSETTLASQVKGNSSTHYPKLSIKNLDLSNGDFTYIDKSKNGMGKINITNIDVKMDQLSFFSKDADKTTTAKASGNISGGRVDLDIKSKIFKKPYESSLTLKIKSHELKPLNQYFDPVYGIKMSGKILNGDSQVQQKGKSIHSKTRFAFQGIKLDFKETKERSQWMAFFMDQGVEIAICNKNTDTPDQKIYKEATYDRKKESIVSFFLMGILQSALKVVCLS